MSNGESKILLWLFQLPLKLSLCCWIAFIVGFAEYFFAAKESMQLLVQLFVA